MTPERQALLHSLERHALTYWAKCARSKRLETTDGVYAARVDENLALIHLGAAAKALGEYDATVHPIDEPK